MAKQRQTISKLYTNTHTHMHTESLLLLHATHTRTQTSGQFPAWVASFLTCSRLYFRTFEDLCRYCGTAIVQYVQISRQWKKIEIKFVGNWRQNSNFFVKYLSYLEFDLNFSNKRQQRLNKWAASWNSNQPTLTQIQATLNSKRLQKFWLMIEYWPK